MRSSIFSRSIFRHGKNVSGILKCPRGAYRRLLAQYIPSRTPEPRETASGTNRNQPQPSQTSTLPSGPYFRNHVHMFFLQKNRGKNNYYFYLGFFVYDENILWYPLIVSVISKDPGNEHISTSRCDEIFLFFSNSK